MTDGKHCPHCGKGLVNEVEVESWGFGAFACPTCTYLCTANGPCPRCGVVLLVRKRQEAASV